MSRIQFYSIYDRFLKRATVSRLSTAALAWMMLFQVALASDFTRPWRDNNKALILDAYELNSLDWLEITKNKRIVGFIGKASDGLSAEYCANSQTLCGAKWRKYAVTKELYHTRRVLAKSLGLKWGAYHLARAGNPEMQALHFLQFADPQEDEVIVLDIESMNTDKFMSLSDAERFSKYLFRKIGRYPMLYTNHSTALHIAENRADYPLLSRLKLWYARYKDDIRGTFPMGNWAKPTLWQFSYGGNCSKNSCPYRVKGTPLDIDVNASFESVGTLRKQWPFDGLLDEQPFPETKKPELLLVSNTVEDPEEEKHSKFVLDQDYEQPSISSRTVASTAPIQANSVAQPTKTDEPVSCAGSLETLDSDALAKCLVMY